MPTNHQPKCNEMPDAWCCAAAKGRAIAVALALCASGAAPAAPIPCGDLTRAVNERAQAQTERVSMEEAATAEAVSAARQCLANVSRALNQIAIPGISITIDFSGIISNMINRACQVVTTRIDEAGRIVNGTVSGAANRVIGGINDVIALPPGTGPVVGGGTTSGPGAGGVTSGGMGGNASTPSVPPGGWERIACRIRGTCP